ncbi:HEAT repeat-containing protein 1 [Halyomorpha halys]|uniref:HEAT repeat-containing protein 1 n=1 Tax=Halyomorpha halys TaxID=286706 RepID=UPI0006D4E5B0|nr:HEAT repeat-containing protein 1 homolog [Halyomorpha halys]
MPNTSLALQLKKLQAPQTQLLLHRKKKDSFLFDPKEAANFDRDDIYELGLSGLEELKKLNPNFSAFENTLFDTTSRFFERAVESSEANEKLNDQIKTFLTLLSPYFLLKPAHKALEWLINRYHINQFNIDDIMFLIFPYHETVLFSRMLQLIYLEKNTGKWHWLYVVKKKGVPLSKTALLNRASNDMGFLKFVCDMPAQAIKIHGSRASGLVTLFAFYCTTVVGGLQHADPINELHITQILPSVLAALSSSLIDYTASGYMIIARLATKTCLSPKVLTVLFNKISKVEHAKLRSETTLTLILLCQNNEGKCEFPEKAAARIAEAPWFISSLTTLNKTGIDTCPFLCLLLTTCLKRIQEAEDVYKDFVYKMLTNVKYNSNTAEQIFKILLEEFNGESSDETIKWFSEVIKGLEHSFPQVFDSVVSAALSDEQSKAGVAVKIILGINTSRNDLFLKLVHPNEDVRLQAIKHIGKHFEPDQLAWLSQTLLDRLKDDSPKVVRQFLRLPAPIITTLPNDILVNNLLLVIAKFSLTDEPIVLQAITILINNTTKEHEVIVLIAILPFIISAMHKSDVIENAPSDRLEFLSILKSCAAQETNAAVILWKTFAVLSVIPPVEVLISTFKGSKYLMEHSTFWFSSALLVGSKIRDHPSQDIADQVMNFLTEFLHFPELDTIENLDEIDENTLQSCFESSIKGKLPIQGALYCLSNLSKCIPPHSFTRKPWVDPKNKSNAFTLSVYKVLHEGCNSNSKAVRVAFSQVQTSFFNTHFPDTEFQILFLLNVVILDPGVTGKSLNVVIKMLNNDSSLIPSILKEHCLIVPSLLILLGASEETIRSKTLKILAILTDSLSTGFYRPLVEELVNHSTELLLDNEQIQIFAYKQLSPSKEVKSLLKDEIAVSMGNVLQHLISVITNSSNPLYVKAKILRILELVHSKEIFLELLPMAIQSLGTSGELDEDESYIVTSIFKRLNHSISDVFKEEKFWNSLKIALQDSKSIVLNEDSKVICPAALILNQITKELFDKLHDSLQEKVVSLIMEKITDVENVQVINAAALFFKRISLDSKILLSLFTPMLNVFVPYSPSSLRARTRKSNSCLPSLETLETNEWKRGVCLLEFVQNKKKLSNVSLLLPVLFNLLKKCLQFEQQAPVEYVKQLLLSSILHVCQKLSDGETLLVPLEALQVDVVVECVRASHNPQTHHHALLALSYIAHLLPDQVLHNMMAIFTFIGSSVIRLDDAYSFQLISKIIETIIPILVKSQKGAALEDAVTVVLRVFVAAILDLPEHRRIPLFKKLMMTLNEGEFLWIFLCLVFEKHVSGYSPSENEDKSSDVGAMPRVLSYALQLCAEFPPSTILKTSLNLLQYISKLPHDKETYLLNKPKYSKLNFIYNIDENTGKNFRHYKYTLLTFLSSLMSSTQFVLQVSELSGQETVSMKHLFGSVVEECLVYIKSVSVQIEHSAQQPTAKYWKVVLNQCYDILDKANALLPTEIFIEVVGQLLRNPIEAVRRKAMELLGWKLQQPSPLLQSQLRELLDPLIAVLDSLHSQTVENNESSDSYITHQAALFAIKLMARHLGTPYLNDFIKILAKVTDILTSPTKPSGPVFGSVALCLGELVSMLKVHALPFLPKFLPVLISALHDNLSDNSGDILLLSIVTSIQKIVDVTPQFLSPFLDHLLYEICILSAKYDSEVADQQQKTQSLQLKLKLIRQKLSNQVPTRVLVPAASTAHSKLLENCHYQAIGPLMTILSDSFTSASDLCPETVKLFLSTLEFRTIQPEPSLVESESVENPVIIAFSKLILKLSESSFRPLYQKIFDWATRKKAPRDRIITFYRLSYHLAKSLKSLFPLFLGIFIENAANILTKNNPANETEDWFSGEYAPEKSILVVENIMLTFLTTFTNDSQKCLTKDYFNIIMEPLVDQLENRSGGDELANERCKNILIPCLANMATSTGDDSLWKRLNHQILLKTRHSLAEVRILGLKTTCSLAAKLGEDFMPLLPETVPFLAELLEDNVEEVEFECQKVVNEMEEILGESIQKYF